MQPLQQDLFPPFDTTALTEISGSQLYQFGSGTIPYTDKGLNLVTTDVAGVPQIPDVNGTPRWANYHWKRISPLTSAMVVYAWNPNNTSFIYYSDGSISFVESNWCPIAAAVPTPPTGDAGGDLDGTYPNPTIRQNIVDGGLTGKLATGVNSATLANNIAVPASSFSGSPAGANAGTPIANDRVVVNSSIDGFCTVRKALDGLAEPSLTEAGKTINVNGAGTGFEYIAPPATYSKATIDGGDIPAAGDTAVIPHTLAGTPQSCRVVIRCISNDAASGYVTGDEIEMYSTSSSSDGAPIMLVSVGSVNVSVLKRPAGAIQVPKKGDGTMTTIGDSAHFNLKVYAVFFN